MKDIDDLITIDYGCGLELANGLIKGSNWYIESKTHLDFGPDANGIWTQEEAFKKNLEVLYAMSIHEDSHVQPTPFDLCLSVVQKIIDQNPGKRWLVIANLEFLFVVRSWFKYAGRSLNDLWFASPSPIKLKTAKSLLKTENVIQYKYESIKSWEPSMKFDVIVGNPPYNGILHLNILNSAVKCLAPDGVLKFIHPSHMIAVQRDGNNLKRINQIKKEIDDRKMSVKHELITSKQAGFSIGDWFPLSITTVKNDELKKYEVTALDGETQSVRSLYDLSLYGDMTIIQSILDKIQAKCPDNLKNHYRDRGFEFYVPIGTFSGQGKGGFDPALQHNFDGHDYVIDSRRLLGIRCSTPILNDIFMGVRGQRETGYSVGFHTLTEAENFKSFLTRTHFTNFIVSFYKYDQNVGPTFQYVPWLDWNVEWTDEKINEHFGFGDDEVELIRAVTYKIAAEGDR